MKDAIGIFIIAVLLTLSAWAYRIGTRRRRPQQGGLIRGSARHMVLIDDDRGPLWLK